MNKTAIVTEIQHTSFHDGPGIRTTVFFKGCPLSCVWCHNPECINKEPEILRYPEKCIGCGRCDDGCFAGAKVICGKEMTASEIFDEIHLDKPYYSERGGVTFSGGEALIYPEMLKELISLCKKENISTAIETSLYIFDKEVFENLDFIMADFKIFNDEKHKKYTGVSNKIIKENFIELDKLGVPFIVRTPLIPGITDNLENITAIRDYIRSFKNIKGYELLEYNPFGNQKPKAQGKAPVVFDAAPKIPKEFEKYANLQG